MNQFPDAKNADNPFRTFYIGKNIGYAAHKDARNRISCVQNFSLEDCKKALQMDDLQETVREAIQQRIRKLEVHFEN
ncbi:MAG: hypothetical protein WED82_02060 [Balneolales bacterium]